MIAVVPFKEPKTPLGSKIAQGSRKAVIKAMTAIQRPKFFEYPPVAPSPSWTSAMRTNNPHSLNINGRKVTIRKRYKNDYFKRRILCTNMSYVLSEPLRDWLVSTGRFTRQEAEVFLQKLGFEVRNLLYRGYAVALPGCPTMIVKRVQARKRNWTTNEYETCRWYITKTSRIRRSAELLDKHWQDRGDIRYQFLKKRADFIQTRRRGTYEGLFPGKAIEAIKPKDFKP